MMNTQLLTKLPIYIVTYTFVFCSQVIPISCLPSMKVLTMT